MDLVHTLVYCIYEGPEPEVGDTVSRIERSLSSKRAAWSGRITDCGAGVTRCVITVRFQDVWAPSVLRELMLLECTPSVLVEMDFYSTSLGLSPREWRATKELETVPSSRVTFYGADSRFSMNSYCE